MKIIKEHIGFHYLLTKLELYTFILWGKSITDNRYRIQDNESIMCRFYYIAFIEYMLAGKALLDYTNCFSPNNYRNNDKLLYKYFKYKYGRRSKFWV